MFNAYKIHIESVNSMWWNYKELYILKQEKHFEFFK